MTDSYFQIDSHLLVYVGVLLVFFVGCTLLGLIAVAFASTVLAGAAAFGIINRGWRLLKGMPGFFRSLWRSNSRPDDAGLPLSMEEALRQVATGKTDAVQGTSARAADTAKSSMAPSGTKDPPVLARSLPTGPGLRPLRPVGDARTPVRKIPLRR